MTHFIHHFLIFGFLVAVLGASREVPEEDPNSFKSRLAQANDPFSLPEGLQMGFQPIKMNSLDDFRAQGVKLRVKKAFNVDINLRKKLSSLETQFDYKFDEVFYSKAQRIFGEPYVTAATFLQWTSPDNELVRKTTNSPEEVEAVLADKSGNRLQLVFKVDRSHYRFPSSSVTFTKIEGAKFEISRPELEEVLKHITTRLFPDSLLNFYIEKLALEDLPSFVAKIPTWRYDNWSTRPNGAEYRGSEWIIRYERRDAETGMNLVFFEQEHTEKSVEVTDPNNRRFKIASTITEENKDLRFEIWVNKDQGTTIKLSEAKATELIAQISAAAVLPTTAASVVAFLADPNSPSNLSLDLNPTRDVDLRIVQLVAKLKI